jgi:hypothetical protein
MNHPPSREDIVVLFPDWYEGPVEDEFESKGYLSGVEIACGARRWFVTFIDDYTRNHPPSFSNFSDEPYVVLPAITRSAMVEAARLLVESGEIERVGIPLSGGA